MANKYSEDDRTEALKLADEIGTVAAAQRLDIKEDIIYGWRNRAKKRGVVLNKVPTKLGYQSFAVYYLIVATK